MIKFNVDYFIDKFEAIPDNRWTKTALKDNRGRCCALGHCGMVLILTTGRYKGNEESKALQELFVSLGINVSWVNDIGYKGHRLPKARIIAALRDIKAARLE